MSATKCYVYGVIADESLAFEVDAVNEADRVYTVEYRDLSAVVSDVDTMDPERSDENVRAHDEVLQAVMERDGGRTVVPMQFGMVFERTRALKNVLRSGRRAFEKALRETEGMVELGLKVVGPQEADVDREDVTETVASELEPRSERETDNETFSDRLLLNRSYLVERSEREGFDDAIDRLRDEHENVSVQYTGPWPPYNFVDIQVGVEQ